MSQASAIVADSISAAELESCASETAAFERMLPELLKNSAGKFVAMRDGKVIDSDADQFNLARRIDVNWPDGFVLIREVCPSREPEEIPNNF